jgi:hypothetical protein
MHTCMCGGEAVPGVDTYVSKAMEVCVYSVPCFRCVRCGEVSFDIGTRVSSCAAYAYRNGMYEIDYADWCDGKYGEDE